jgi:hypothetical protein
MRGNTKEYGHVLVTVESLRRPVNSRASSRKMKRFSRVGPVLNRGLHAFHSPPIQHEARLHVESTIGALDDSHNFVQNRPDLFGDRLDPFLHELGFNPSQSAI